jgi:hypothetical protein
MSLLAYMTKICNKYTHLIYKSKFSNIDLTLNFLSNNNKTHTKQLHNKIDIDYNTRYYQECLCIPGSYCSKK